MVDFDDKEFFTDNHLGIQAPEGPLQPSELNPDSTIQFRCHKGISCFNACCKSIDIILTPYDIVRLKNRMQMSSDDFLIKYTMPFEMDHHGMPGVKLRPQEGGTACQFMTEEGCSVYEDRPTACRYYPVGNMGMRRKDEAQIANIFFLVKEDHCKGHDEDRQLTVQEYRQEQGVEEYDRYNHMWREIVIKKRSAGPTIGNPSERSLQLFQMASYEMDHFRRFINSDSFKNTFDLKEQTYTELNNDETLLLDFGIKFLKQVLFGEQYIPLKEHAREERLAKRKEQIQQRRTDDVDSHRSKDIYQQDKDK